MIRYKTFRPTSFDHNIPIDGKDEWLVVPCGRNRDSDCLTESNFQTARNMLAEAPLSEEATLKDEEDWIVPSFGHWACGEYSLILVRPESPAHKVAQDIEAKLENYPMLDENDVSERQHKAANETWKNCYTNSQRLQYIRDNRSQFDFHDMTDLMQCVRGYHFAGYASELIGE